MEMKLCDDFKKRGKSLEAFKDALNEVDGITMFEHFNTRDIEVLSYDSNTEKPFGFLELSNSAIAELWEGKKPNELFFSKEELVDMGATEELIRELTVSRLLLKVNGNIYFISPESTLGTIATKIRLGGDEFFRSSNLRDALIVEKFNKLGINVTMMSRAINGIHKCFAIHSESYAETAQTMLMDIINNLSSEMGTPVVDEWEINNFMTHIILKFPDKAKEISDYYGLPDQFVPGLYLGTSDTGESSLTAMGVWLHNGCHSYSDVYKKKHQGKIDPENVLENINNEIFSKYTKLPERLAKLMSIDIDKELLPDVYETILKQSGMRDALGKKLCANLHREIVSEIGAGHYTAYNVAVKFLDLPNRIICTVPLEKSVQLAIEKAATKAVFCNIEKAVKEANPSLILGA